MSGGFGLAFPDGEDAPAEAAEGAAGAAVAGGVLLDFGEPVFAVGGGDAAGPAGVLLRRFAAARKKYVVPETWD